jgi:hypothetical protein
MAFAEQAHEFAMRLLLPRTRYSGREADEYDVHSQLCEAIEGNG